MGKAQHTSGRRDACITMAHRIRNSDTLPIDSVLPAVAESLAANRAVVLQAPPGSGKTTRVAPALLDEPWLQGRKIVMLEPRRLAARRAAIYMAGQRNEPVGATVGYQVRLERVVGPATRIEILTEGLLVQRLLRDPESRDVGAIIFDEFHERSLQADTALALTKDVRQALRPDLRLLVMSATLDPEPLAEWLGGADIRQLSARMFPVETRLFPPSGAVSLAMQAAQAVRRALREEPGSVLVFLPGEREIRQTETLLREGDLPSGVLCYPLYGALSREEQDRAVAPPAAGQRKVVLATSIAETSLTIEGIRVVIDSGWSRVPRFSPRHGMTRLDTVRVTRDRADQRRGRAGRLCAGVCYRLWDAVTDQRLAAEARPEILDADLTPVVLQSAEWGTVLRDGLPWFTPPPEAAWRQAITLLQDLGALTSPLGGVADQNSRVAITAHGRAMAQMPLHPRLAHMVRKAAEAGCGRQAALLAAALTELATSASARRERDARNLLDTLGQRDNNGYARRALELARRWSATYPAHDRLTLSTGRLLAWAYPERVARRRDTAGRYLLRSGRGAVLETTHPLAGEEWLVAAELQDGGAEAKIRMAAPLTFDEVDEIFRASFTSVVETYWDERIEAVQAVRRVMLGAIVIREGKQADPDVVAVREALFEGIRQKGIAQLPWTPQARALQARICFLHRTMPSEDWPDVSDDALLCDLARWLTPFCDGIRRWSHIRSLDMHAVLLYALERCGCSRRALDDLAPARVRVPSGSAITLQYEGVTPTLAVRIQEVFGMRETPRVAGGRVAVLMCLLSPAHRPVQVTGDLESFWRNGYALVRKDLRGRYPKHDWPENPLDAAPTTRPRPRNR